MLLFHYKEFYVICDGSKELDTVSLNVCMDIMWKIKKEVN